MNPFAAMSDPTLHLSLGLLAGLFTGLLIALALAWWYGSDDVEELLGGDIGPIGWCGQDGYWWIRPCPHVDPDFGGCGWFDGERIAGHVTEVEVH